MAIMTSYLDTSGSSDQVVIATAALVAPPDKWEEFDKRWNSCLSSFNVSSLHMKEYAHSRREFELWKNDYPKRHRFMNELLWIIEDLVDYTAACSIYVDDYRYIDKDYRISEVMRPYTLACLNCASSIVPWAKQNGHDRDELIWVFEKGDEDQNDLRKRWDIAYPNANVSPTFCKKKDFYPDKTTCRYIRPFEAADLIAYEHQQVHRLLEKKQGADLYEDELRRPLQRMNKWNSAKDWKVCDIESLKKLCDLWHIEPR